MIRCVLSSFCPCILLKRYEFKLKPYISVGMPPLVQDVIPAGQRWRRLGLAAGSTIDYRTGIPYPVRSVELDRPPGMGAHRRTRDPVRQSTNLLNLEANISAAELSCQQVTSHLRISILSSL